MYKSASLYTFDKKANLDWNDPANFRPISNLHTISITWERLFLTRIIWNIEFSPNFNRYQSASSWKFNWNYPTLPCKRYMLCCRQVGGIPGGTRHVCCFRLYQYSLVRRLELYTFCFSGTAVPWLTSYLSHKQQFNRVGDYKSNTVTCICGVQQGSVLGPELYCSPCIFHLFPTLLPNTEFVIHSMLTTHNCTLNVKTITLTVNCRLASYRFVPSSLPTGCHLFQISRKLSSSAASRAQLLTVSIHIAKQVWHWASPVH